MKKDTTNYDGAPENIEDVTIYYKEQLVSTICISLVQALEFDILKTPIKITLVKTQVFDILS